MVRRATLVRHRSRSSGFEQKITFRENSESKNPELRRWNLEPQVAEARRPPLVRGRGEWSAIARGRDAHLEPTTGRSMLDGLSVVEPALAEQSALPRKINCEPPRRVRIIEASLIASYARRRPRTLCTRPPWRRFLGYLSRVELGSRSL